MVDFGFGGLNFLLVCTLIFKGSSLSGLLEAGSITFALVILASTLAGACVTSVYIDGVQGLSGLLEAGSITTGFHSSFCTTLGADAPSLSGLFEAGSITTSSIPSQVPTNGW